MGAPAQRNTEIDEIWRNCVYNSIWKYIHTGGHGKFYILTDVWQIFWNNWNGNKKIIDPRDIRDIILLFNLASVDSQFSMCVNMYIRYVKIFNENVLRQGRSSKKFWNYFFKNIILGIISMPFSLIPHS